MMFLKNTKFVLILLFFIGTLLRFYNLNWGAPFYFHPDERNIASGVTALHFPNKLDPHFYAYGSLPIYAIYFVGMLANTVYDLIHHVPLTDIATVSFEQAIIISRCFSAVFSSLLIIIMYFIGKRLFGNYGALLAAAFTTFSTGLIQFAHFGTFEMWLTLFSVVLFYYCLELLEKNTWRKTVKTAGILSILIAVKVSSVALIILPLITLFLSSTIWKFRLKRLLIFSGKTILTISVACVLSLLLTPFLFLNHKDFMGSMHYETSVAIGSEQVFYVGEFYNTVPVIFQFLHVYPFLINPILTIIFVPCFLYFLVIVVKKKNFPFLIIISFFLILFFSQAFLFVKWTRYIVPTLPFMYLTITERVSKWRKKKFTKLISGILVASSIIFSVSYTITVYGHPFTTVSASDWANSRIPHNAKIVSEVYDMGIVPFNQYYNSITLFNFYDLDNNIPGTTENLAMLLSQSSYIILPSQRVEKIRLSNPQMFPEGHKFYYELQHGMLGFIPIYQTPCDIFCKITYLGDPVSAYEETANVFDRPTVFIFKKTQNLTTQKYQQLL